MVDSINCIIVAWDGNGELKAEDGVFLRYLNCVKEKITREKLCEWKENYGRHCCSEWCCALSNFLAMFSLAIGIRIYVQ